MPTLKTTPGTYFCNQNQASSQGGAGSRVPKDLYRILGTFPGGFSWIFAFYQQYKEKCITFGFQRATQASRTIINYLPCTGPIATIKPWLMGGGWGEIKKKEKEKKKQSKTKKIKKDNCLRDKLSFQVWRSNILFSTSEARSEAGILSPARTSSSGNDSVGHAMVTQCKNVTEMEESIVHKRFFIVSLPYSLMKSAFLWTSLHCRAKWVPQSRPVLQVYFSAVTV